MQTKEIETFILEQEYWKQICLIEEGAIECAASSVASVVNLFPNLEEMT